MLKNVIMSCRQIKENIKFYFYGQIKCDQMQTFQSNHHAICINQQTQECNIKLSGKNVFFSDVQA